MLKKMGWLLLSMCMAFDALAGDLQVEGAQVRMPPPVADTAAAYMTLVNTSDKPLMISHVSTNISASADIHEMMMHGNMMHMQKMEQPTIAPNASMALQPGGNHLMLVGLKKELTAGEMIHLVITLNTGETMEFDAPVVDMRDMNHTGHGHAHH